MPENENWTEDVLRSVEDNHIWINALSNIRPSDEFAAGVGRMVLEMLNESERLIKPRVALIDSERNLVLRINQS